MNVTYPPTIGTGQVYVLMQSERVLDTRTGQGGIQGPVGSNQVVGVQVGGQQAVPPDAVGVIGNLTVVSPTFSGWITCFGSNTSGMPPTSNINFVAGQAPVANTIVVPLGNQGTQFAGNLSIKLWPIGAQSGTVHLILDVFGYLR